MKSKVYSVDHLCTLEEQESDSGMYSLPPLAPWYQHLWRNIRKSLTISVCNPRSTEFYRSVNGIMAKRREHLYTHPYIIHPLSTFRIFYEIFISLVYIGALILMPLSLAFHYFLSHRPDYKRVEIAMVSLCSLDIFVNFITGYANDAQKDVVLDPVKIAIRYAMSGHLVCDTLSTLSLVDTRNYRISRILDIFALLRISRLPTVFEYINNAAEYFRTMKNFFKILRYCIVTLILFHLFACLLFWVPQLDSLITLNTFGYQSDAWIFKYDPTMGKNEIHIVYPFAFYRAVAFLLSALIFMPLSLAFDYFLSHMKAYKRAEVTMILLCVFDIFMNFITGYADDSAKDAVLSPAKIAKHYIRTLHFFCDTLSTVSLIKFKNYKVSKILDLFGLLRMSRLPTVFEYINDSAEYFKTMRKLFKIVRYSIVTLILFHCVGCLLFLVPQLDSLLIDQESFTYRSHTWIFLYDPNLDKNEIHVVYPFAIFRAVAFLLNIETRLEESTTYSDVLMEAASFIFGKIFFLFMTVVILRLFLSKRSLETKYYEKVNQIEGYMRQKQLPATLQEKILEFYEYKYNRKYFKESDITEMFSDLLKKEINMHVCQDLVNNVNLFEGLPPRSLEDILAQLKVEIFLPNDLIIKAGLYGDCMYFLARGTVAVSAPSGREVCHLEDGAYFGEICLVFRDKKRTANVVALEICEVYRLDKKAFTNIFSKHPELFQKLEVVANERLADTQLVEDSCKQVLFGKLR